MEIGLIFSVKDPRQARARDFVKKFVRERGILAKIVETERQVKSPTVIIDGHTLTEKRKKPREKRFVMYPSVDDIARALEEHIWCI